MNPELLNGIIIGIGGLIIVFVGLLIIEFVIALFSQYFAKKEQKTQTAAGLPSIETKKNSAQTKHIAIPEEDVVAIATTIELYRKIHFEQLPSQITFIHGNQQSNWKIGSIASQFLRK